MNAGGYVKLSASSVLLSRTDLMDHLAAFQRGVWEGYDMIPETTFGRGTATGIEYKHSQYHCLVSIFISSRDTCS